jgi:tetratricopeptide (TPR) repeat protein
MATHNPLEATGGPGAVIYRGPEADDTLLTLHQLTPPVADFTGRVDELVELRRKAKQGAVTITSRRADGRGSSGVGKTQLARRLAAELMADYPDAQFELDLKGASPQPLSPAEALSGILRLFDPTMKLPERTEELAAVLRRVLEGRRTLLLLDNANDPAQIEPFLPPPPGCLIIVTARQELVLPDLETLGLGVLSPADASALLLKIAPRIGSEAEAVAEGCARLPLALRLAASFLAVNERSTPAGWVRGLRDFAKQIVSCKQGQELTAEEVSLQASFALGFFQLPPESQDRFAQLSVFAGSFYSTAAATVWALEPAAARGELGGLVRLGLVEWNQQTQRCTFPDWVREQTEVHDLDAARRRHAEHFIRAGDKWESFMSKGEKGMRLGAALFDRERGNMQAAFDWLASRSDPESARMLISLVNGLAYTIYFCLPPRERVRWLEAQAKAARQTGDRNEEANALGNLGSSYGGLGELGRAIAFHQQALGISRELGDRNRECTGLRNLGLDYTRLGDTAKAIEYHEQALVIACELGDRQEQQRNRDAIERLRKATTV